MRRRLHVEDAPSLVVPETLARFVATEWEDGDGNPLPNAEARYAFHRAWKRWTLERGMDVHDATMFAGAARRHAADPTWPMPSPGMTPHPTPLKRSDWKGPILGHPWEWR